jgi:hypothetical protein
MITDVVEFYEPSLPKLGEKLGVTNLDFSSESESSEAAETTIENAAAYLDRAVAEFATLSDGRQGRATQVCYWLGRVIGAKTGDPRLEFQTVKQRLTSALEKTKWPREKFEVIERQLRAGEKNPVKIVEDDTIEVRNWPEPPAEEAFSGLVGEFTKLWKPHTEASPVALAAQFITFFGHSIGRKPFFAVGGDDHHTNLEIALVGPTSFARKGQSYGCVKHTFDKVQLQLGIPYNEATGLSSGEGLINAVRDPRSENNKKGESVVADAGVSDKRLLVFESEFASVLRRMVREGNTLSEITRQAWDSGNLGTMTRNAPLRATNTHISLITHVTPSDLQLYLNDVSTMNGFANRFIFLATRRVCSLPDPGRPSDSSLRAFASRLAHAIEFSQLVREMKRSTEAVTAWEELYKRLSEPRTGRQHNAVVARAAAHVLRLSMIYALLDESCIIETRHLESAVALWDYAERTSRFVFGDSLGDKVAEKILELLKTEPGGLTTREIRAKFTNKKHVPDALRLLHENGQVREESLKQSQAHRGQRWYAA